MPTFNKWGVLGRIAETALLQDAPLIRMKTVSIFTYTGKSNRKRLKNPGLSNVKKYHIYSHPINVYM